MRSKQHLQKTWKNNLRGIINIFLFLTSLILALYSLFVGNFSPSISWIYIGIIIVILTYILTVLPCIYTYPHVKSKSKKSNLNPLSKPKKILLFTYFSFFWLCILWKGLCLGLGMMVTDIAGHSYSQQIHIKRIYSGARDLLYREGIVSDDIPGFNHRIRLREDEFQLLPSNHLITIYGKQSYLGFVYKGFNLSNTKDLSSSNSTR